MTENDITILLYNINHYFRIYDLEFTIKKRNEEEQLYHDFVFIWNKQNGEQIGFLRKDCGSFALRIFNPKGGYICSEKLNIKPHRDWCKFDINKMKDAIDKWRKFKG